MKKSPLLTVLGYCLLAATSRAEILVDESFTDNERRTDGAPSSLQWTYGAHRPSEAFTSLDPSGGQLFWDHTSGVNSSYSGIWGHFASADAPFTLTLGETLTLSFTVTFSGGSFSPSTNAFRWALFDSNDHRVTTDFAGSNLSGISSGSKFGNWKGYVAQLAVNSTEVSGNSFLTRERGGSGSGLYTSGEYTDVPGSAVDEPSFEADVAYSASLSLERTAAGVVVQASIGGVSTVAAVDASPRTQFDTISFFTLDTLTQDITLDDISLTVIPEPSSAVLLGVAGAALLGWRRRRA